LKHFRFSYNQYKGGTMPKKKLINVDFSKIGENITILMNACGIDATELSKLTGLPTSTISRLRSNSTESSPNLSSLIPIADFFRVTLSQLIGEDPINKSVYGTFKPSKLTKIPLPVLCADNITKFVEHRCLKTDFYLDVPLIEIDFQLSEKSFAYFLQGNAMEPQFPDRTLLIIDPEANIENLDHVLVIPTGKKIPIFRQVMIDGDEKYLRTLNPTFNEFVKFDEEAYNSLGVMVQSRQTFKNTVSVRCSTSSVQIN
jgi:transcriptional regulator with XRE-family HTH domain